MLSWKHLSMPIKSVMIGGAIEAAFAGAGAAGGFGPCGPSNILGFIGMMTHLFPGIIVMFIFKNAPGWLGVTILVIVQAAFWSILAALIFSWRKVRP